MQIGCAVTAAEQVKDVIVSRRAGEIRLVHSS